MSRRDFVATGAAVPVVSALGGAGRAALTGEEVRVQDGGRRDVLIDFTGDGQAHSPADYAQALARILADGGVEADYYSLGGVVEALEERMAEVLGKERAVFLPTGTLANHLAVRIQARGRPRVIVQEESHIYNDSGDCSTVLSDLNLIPLARGAGTFTVQDVREVLDRASGGRVRTDVGVIVIESPIRRRLGELFDYGEMERVCRFARERGIATHLDGARLFMATGYMGNPPREVAAHFDTVYVSMWKYFNAPSGAILAGPRALLDDLFHERRMFGGALPQAWPFAALALRYIDGFEERFAMGIAASEELIAALEGMSGARIERVPNGSNVFKLHLEGVDPEVVRRRLAERNVVVPAPAGGFRGFALKVNETLARRPVTETVTAFSEAIGG
jgi:threonine aldolase